MSRTILALLLTLSACQPVAPAPSSRPPAPTSAPSIETGGPLSLELVAEGINKPTALADAGDRGLFVTEQGGRVRVIQDGELLADPVLDLTDRVLAEGERGLLGIAVHPEFAANGRFFVTYSNLEGDTELREFNIQDDVNAEGHLLLEVPKKTVFHQAGALEFGPDGYLYASIGDDGRQDTNRADPNSILGTILRLDVAEVGRYAIPPDNPFADGGGAQEVWDYGLRNPWRFSFDSVTGDLYIGDVGQHRGEEINLHPAGTPGGLDFGWIATEGFDCRVEGCDTEGITWPVVAYDHEDGQCGAIGGYVLRSDQASAGRYLYADLCSGEIWSLPAGGGGDPKLEIDSKLRISSFGVDNAGTVYVLVIYTNGSVYRVTG
jgi:glucose/arabinose dehydrogenase